MIIIAVGNQDVNGIRPPHFSIPSDIHKVGHNVMQTLGSLFPVLPRIAREPREEKTHRGDALLELPVKVSYILD
jgi:hypothetical protein